MAQEDPEPNDANDSEDDLDAAGGAVDPSHELDLVTLFSSGNHDAEMEATSVQSLMEANGIPAVLVGSSALPVLEFQVQVPRAQLEEARQILSEARAAGPEAAAEAEAEGEKLSSEDAV
jgi:hypothetical protein